MSNTDKVWLDIFEVVSAQRVEPTENMHVIAVGMSNGRYVEINFDTADQADKKFMEFVDLVERAGRCRGLRFRT